MRPLLNVIAVISNPVRYQSRYDLYKKFEEHMLSSKGVRLVTVEASLGDRPFVITSEHNPNHVQLRAGPESELWLKESLINVGIKHLTKIDPNWKYVAWIDADVKFLDPNWAIETVEQLQHYKIVQPWATAIDLGPKHEVMSTAQSFCWCHWNDPTPVATAIDYVQTTKYAEYRHSGYAWAIRRDAFDALGGLIDWCPMGAADHHMAWAFAGDINKAVHGLASDSYKRKALEFQKLCDEHIKQDIGYCNGTIMHEFHGKKRNRFYQERWTALVDTQFNPDTDLTYNADGLVVLSGKNIKLRDALRRYFRSRNEDENTLEE